MVDPANEGLCNSPILGQMVPLELFLKPTTFKKPEQLSDVQSGIKYGGGLRGVALTPSTPITESRCIGRSAIEHLTPTIARQHKFVQERTSLSTVRCLNFGVSYIFTAKWDLSWSLKKLPCSSWHILFSPSWVFLIGGSGLFCYCRILACLATWWTQRLERFLITFFITKALLSACSLRDFIWRRLICSSPAS